MTVLITGGCGLVGSNVARVLAQKGTNCILLDKKTHLWDFLEPLGDRIRMLNGDVYDFENLFEIARKNKVEGIIHLAAVKYEKDCKTNPLNAYNINCSSTLNVLEIARRLNMRRVLFASSGAVFGEWKDRNASIREEDTPTLRGLYPTMKRVSELMLEGFRRVYSLDFASFRISRVYGPGVIHAEPESHPVRTIAYKCVYEGKVEEPSGLDFAGDFSFVEDVADGIGGLYTADKLSYSLYHLGGGILYQVTDIVKILKEIFPDVSIAVGPGDQPYAGQAPIRGPLCIERAKNEIGYEVKYSLSDGIKKYAAWLSLQKNKRSQE